MAQSERSSKRGDFIAFLTPSGNLLTGNFEGKTDLEFFVIKNRAFEYATMDVVDQWAYVEDLKAIDSLRARIGELEGALKKIGENPVYDKNCDEWYNRDDVDFIIKEALKGAGK